MKMVEVDPYWQYRAASRLSTYATRESFAYSWRALWASFANNPSARSTNYALSCSHKRRRERMGGVFYGWCWGEIGALPRL